MRNIWTIFANDYALRMDDVHDEGDERRRINNPIVFLFLGDEVSEALDVIHGINRRKWLNSSGVVYLQVHTSDQATIERENVYNWKLSLPQEDKRTLRPVLHERFHQDEEKLFELNVLLRNMYSKIAEYGRMYASLQRVNIAVVTRVDDPCNVLLPDLTVLIESLFQESFRSVQVDLYALLNTNSGEGFGYASSMGLGFLSEVEMFQRRDYKYEKLLQVTQDQIKLPCIHGPSPLFDLVFLLSNQDERGIVSEHGIRYNYEIICHLNLLKNRDISKGVVPELNPYNNQQFKQNLYMDHQGSGNCYVSAGFSHVRRPNKTIALTVVRHSLNKLINRLEENSWLDTSLVLDVLGLRPMQMEQTVRELLPPQDEILNHMYGLIHEEISYDTLKHMSMEQAEYHLYGDSAKAFLRTYVDKAEEAYRERQDEEQFRKGIRERVLDDPNLGFYCLSKWTDAKGKDSVLSELQSLVLAAESRKDELKAKLDLLGQERVEVQTISRIRLLGWMSKKFNLSGFTQSLLEKVYGLHYEMAVTELLLKHIKMHIYVLEEFHAQGLKYVEQLNGIRSLLSELSSSAASETSGYLGCNIDEYYLQVVDTVMGEWEQRYGKKYMFDDRFFGSLMLLLEKDEDAFALKLIEVVNQDLFTHRLFLQSFEDELLDRANVAVRYESDDALTKSGLFRELYETLEKEASIRLDVYQSGHKHRYEEKYLIGDYKSEFIQYAFQTDHKNLSCKVGCVDERMRSGVEKLNLMGGFRLQDTMFYRNAKRYYVTYVTNGYEFHPPSFHMEIERNNVFREYEEA